MKWESRITWALLGLATGSFLDNIIGGQETAYLVLALTALYVVYDIIEIRDKDSLTEGESSE